MRIMRILLELRKSLRPSVNSRPWEEPTGRLSNAHNRQSHCSLEPCTGPRPVPILASQLSPLLSIARTITKMELSHCQTLASTLQRYIDSGSTTERCREDRLGRAAGAYLHPRLEALVASGPRAQWRQGSHQAAGSAGVAPSAPATDMKPSANK